MKRLRPDQVFIATGALPAICPFRGSPISYPVPETMVEGLKLCA
jgi:hypothetical protein